MPDPLLLVTIGGAVLAAGFIVAGSIAFGRRHPVGYAGSVLVGIVLALAAALAGTVSVATRGYRALTREEVAATVHVQPTGQQRFRARFSFPDGRVHTYDLRGDQLYVDAHILKWTPIANVVGLHTAYELDRVGGRYSDVGAERDSLRTVFSLAEKKPLDMFRLRRKWSILGPVVDAEYGSGTFHEVDRPATFDVRVSTTGLLIRAREPS